jgi:putative FmdB family regulatory protein
MPIYEYECAHCGTVEEAFQHFSDKPLTKCKHCSGKLHRLISHSSFHLKGSGWYVTDYAKKSSPSPTKSKKAETSSGDTTSSSNTSGSASDTAS